MTIRSIKHLTGFLATLLAFSGTALAADDPVLATVNGHEIRQSQVYQQIAEQYVRSLNNAKAYKMLKGTIDDIIEQELITADAAKKGTSIDAIMTEMQKNAKAPSEEQAKAMFQAQKKRFGNRTYEQAKPQLMAELAQSSRYAAYNQYIDSLKQTAKIDIKVEQERTPVSVDDDPGIGNPKAPVVMVEFSDYQCPYCKRTRETIKKITETYKNKVYYVFRDFPLGFHKQAIPAANAANCAGEQNKYWEFSEHLWDNQGKQTDELFFQIAKDVGLKADTFKECVQSNKYAQEIQKDQQDGAAAGVTGTPAYFINGIMISGAAPFKDFADLIDTELKSQPANGVK